jgi:hypothetical protein
LINDIPEVIREGMGDVKIFEWSTRVLYVSKTDFFNQMNPRSIW